MVLKKETKILSDTKTASSDTGHILIVGGYGQVGLSIAKQLALLFPGRVTIAGRNLKKAQIAASEVGSDTKALAIDIFGTKAEEMLDGVMLAIVCLDQPDTQFVEHCLSRGIHYVDISAEYDFLARVEGLDDLAKRNGAAAVLSVGVAPGLTNMLSRRAKEKMERIDRVDIILEIGIGDHHGQAAVEWMFDNLDATYAVKENGHPKLVRSFGESIKINLPGQKAEQPAYRFNFSDQHVIGHTLDVPSVSTWVRFDNRLATWLFAKLSQAGLGKLLQQRWLRRVAVWLFMNIHMGSDICGVGVRATGRTKEGGDSLTLGILGHKEVMMTAIVAAEVTRQVLAEGYMPGVYHSEQVIDLDQIVCELSNQQADLVFTLNGSGKKNS